MIFGESPVMSDKTTIAEILEKWVSSSVLGRSNVPALALCGAQGIGKTTGLRALESQRDLNVALLSLDDFYLTRSEREDLAVAVHPLCRTRGAPGTHDIRLLKDTIRGLRSAGLSDSTTWPKFDKVTDDRGAELNRFAGKPDAILLEGWLIGALADSEAPRSQPLNGLEQAQDPSGDWRKWQEEALAEVYEPLWQMFDDFLYLCAPSFETVFSWRCEQEETTLALPKGSLPPEKREWVAKFIQHYERITRRILAGNHMPGVRIPINANRLVSNF